MTRHKEADRFAEAVRSVVRSIKPGTTMSYSAVAKQAGYPKAARAVARVMSQNYDKTVPCHRVILSSGKVGGYNRGGAAAKSTLLRQEGWLSTSSQETIVE